MPTVTQVNDLKINKLTKAQYDEAVQSGVIGENEISIITDLDAGQVIQVDVLPTASATEEGKIYQYIGETDNTYTNGYFYKCTETLSFVGPAEDATEGEPGESMVFALDSDAFAAYLQTKSIVYLIDFSKTKKYRSGKTKKHEQRGEGRKQPSPDKCYY